ncbi:MAG: hypothetical protein GX622_13980 [Bacteroidales bacterium]|nr:hypothetical protein [Bacteroidales bacterium]
MLLYLTLLLADLLLWFILLRELKERNNILRLVIMAFKALVSAIFIFLFFSITLYNGEFADPANAFRQIQMGAISILLLVTSSACILISVILRLTSALIKGRHRGTGLANSIIFLLLTLLIADGYFRQRLNVRTIREEVSVDGLDPALDGMKIALISDLHISSWYGSYEKLDRAMLAISGEEPDLLVNTGDFITFGWQEFGSSDTILRKARAAAGGFAVEGNHDDGTYYPEYDKEYGRVCREMVKQKTEESGYTLLRDTAVIVRHRGADIAVAGVITRGHRLDMSYGNFEQVLAPLPDSILTILLLHDPAGWLMSSVSGRLPNLTLSGHTHGFQAGLPVTGWSPSALVQERWKGLHEFRGRHLYVTTGLGTMGMAVRIFMPPEIVILTLRTR